MVFTGVPLAHPLCSRGPVETECGSFRVYDQDNNIVKSVLRGHLWDKEILALPYRGPFKRGSIHMKFSMTGKNVTFYYR
jgi:hypothetical protein